MYSKLFGKYGSILFAVIIMCLIFEEFKDSRLKADPILPIKSPG